MKHFFTILSLLLISNITINAQNWVWGIKGTGTSLYNDGTAKISTDNNGNSVIAGYFQQNMTLDGHALSSPDDYYSDMFLGRVDTKGHVLWLISIEAGDTYNDHIGLTTDDDKNIYLTGGKDGCIFVSKYDSTGVLLWTNNFGKQYYGYGRDVAVDQFDNVVVIGGDGWDFFIAKLNFYGEQIWVKDPGMNYSNAFNASDIDVDALGNIYFIATNDVDSVKLDNIVFRQKGSSFWGKIDPTGKFVWIKAASGHTNENPQIALTRDNNLILSGGFSSTLTVENLLLRSSAVDYNWTPYMLKYDTSGNFKWAKTADVNTEGGAPSELKVDYNSNIYLAGNYFTCYGTFCTEGDYYLKKFNPSGDLLFRKEFKSLNNDNVYGIDIDGNGNLYNIGYTASASFTEELPDFSTGSMGVGKLNTLSTTTKRTERPIVDRLIYNCRGSELTSISAIGQNIKWYDDTKLSKLLFSGNQYQINLQATDTFYVTQTLNNIESWPKEVIVYYADLSNENIRYNKDTLSVSSNKYLSYKWSFNNVEISDANKYFYVPQSNGIYSVKIIAGSCFRTLDFDYERPTRPVVDSLRYVCYKQPVGALNAIGANIIWYKYTDYKDTLFMGNQFNPNIIANKTYYVRQTVNGIASYPQKVTVNFSELNDTILKTGPNYLSTTYNKKFKYQWYLENTLIVNADSNIYVPQNNGLYTVEINDSICNKSLSKYFVMQPKISSTIYNICPGENMPTLNAEGQNLTWLTYDYQKQKYDTLFIGNSFTPQFTTDKAIYLTQSQNNSSSYPLFIQILHSNFSNLSIYNSGSSLYVNSSYSSIYNYSFKWYLNNDTISMGNYSSFYSAPFGKYRIKVSFGTKCDTVLNYSYYPAFDSINYVCSQINQTLTVNSSNIRWYSDINLTKYITTSSTFYPYLNGKDSIFYIAQLTNGKVMWRSKIEVRYPSLDKLSIVLKNDSLVINTSKSYFTYSWQYSGSVLNSNNSFYKPDKDGLYSVIVQAGTCSVKLNYNYIRNSINDINVASLFKIYPNPTKDFISIELKDMTSLDYEIKLYSINGQLINSMHSNTLKTSIDMSNIPLGIYFLELSNGLKIHKFKIIKL